MGNTTIQVDDDTADALHELKERGDSYDDVIRRVLAERGTPVEEE
jgi:predicted CopG family antitoxin